MIMIINDYFTAWSPKKRDFSSFLKNENELLPAILMLSNKVIFLSFVPSPKIELCLFFILFLSQILFFFSIIRMYCVVWLSLKIYLLPFCRNSENQDYQFLDL